MKYLLLIFPIVFVAFVLVGCSDEERGNNPQVQAIDSPDDATIDWGLLREASIPSNAVKMTPQTDSHPPQLHSDEWEMPVPLSGPVNTAGAEDSPFITPDGNTLYFFFTPDPNIPVEKQLLDGVTGIWVSHRSNGQWQETQRVVLQEPDKLALDGCTFVQDDIIWFCSAREGYTGIHWFTANKIDGGWTNWENADFDPKYKVGELHFLADGTQLYFHSDRPGGKGGYDIWVSNKINGEWQEPENIAVVNSIETEGWPYLTSDGSELWFLRTYMGSPGIFRSQKHNGQWSEPELILSSFAGEPSLDIEGNIYFVHHFYRDGEMIEADIYFSRRK